MKDFLTAQRTRDLREHHRAERDGKVRDRIKALLMANDGWTYAAIAQALLLHEDTIAQQITDYVEQGKLALESGGSVGKLKKHQMRSLMKRLDKHLYTTVEAVIDYVKARFGVVYSLAGMTQWLHQHGFSYKQPMGVPCKANSEQQAEFRREYAELKKRCKPDEPVVFLDASHPTMATKFARGWMRTGRSRPVPTTASRTRVNLLGSLALATMTYVGSTHETVNSAAIAVHFQALRAAHPSAAKIHVILDNGAYNRSAATAASAKEYGIALHFLPPYSPNLNPIERLWKVMAEHVRNNRFFTSPDEFRRAINGFFTKTWPRISERMRSRINDNFQRLEPAF